MTHQGEGSDRGQTGVAGSAAAHVADAEKLAANGDWQSALSHLDQAFDEDAQVMRDRPAAFVLDAAVAFARRGDMARAESLVVDLYASDAAARDGFLRLAWSRVDDGDIAGALHMGSRDQQQRRLSANGQLGLAGIHARAQAFDRAQQLVEAAYGSHAGLVDGYARIAQRFFAKRDWANAVTWFDRDQHLDRLSASQQFYYAVCLARLGRWDEAVSRVDEAYARSPQLRDCHARVGWIRTEARDWAGALEIVRRDQELDRISPGWQINLAILHGRIGDLEMAAGLVEAAYRRDAGLTDGYARLGSVRSEAADWQGALALVRRDYYAARISTDWLINLAVLHARVGNDREAAQLVEEAYARSTDARDGFARLGWLKAETKDWSAAFELVERDRVLARLTPAGRVNLAQIHGQLGAFGSAAELIELAYREDADVRDGFARLGWIEAGRGLWSDACEIMARDHKAGRMSHAWRLRFAQTLARCGEAGDAHDAIRSVFDGGPGETGPAVEWLVEQFAKESTIPSRYDHLLVLFSEHRPRTLAEIGVWRGDRAVRFLAEGAQLKRYVGFDLFEDISESTFVSEGMGACEPHSEAAVRRRLAPVAALRGCTVELIAGTTHETLPGFADANRGQFDFVYLDGGHSLETIASDWACAHRMVRPGGLVVFDDYYLNDDTKGAKPLIDGLVKDPAYEVRFFPMIESIIDGLQSTMVAVCVLESGSDGIAEPSDNR